MPKLIWGILYILALFTRNSFCPFNIVMECTNAEIKQGLYKQDKALRACTLRVPKITSLAAIPCNAEVLHCPFFVQV